MNNTSIGVAGGWNSPQMSEATNNALIKKHGFRRWYETLNAVPQSAGTSHNDTEGAEVRKLVLGSRVLELGCGGVKSVPQAVGLDFYAKGEAIPTLNQVSVADVQGSVEAIPESLGKFDTIIARHLLEHVLDPLKALTHWRSFLNPDGRLVLAVPNEEMCESVSLNPEHKHAFTPDSLARLLRASGFTVNCSVNPENRSSFVMAADVVREEAACPA